MFRFLDKRLYRKSEMTFDLKDFAFAHIGLSQAYAKNVGKIKEKLRPAIKELVEAGYLEPLVDEERYVKEGAEWKVIFRRAMPGPSAPEEAEAEHPIARELIDRGVTQATARELARDFPADFVAGKVEVFDWMMAKNDKRASKNPAGYLTKSIRDDFATLKGFKGRAQLEAERLAAQEAGRLEEARKAEARANAARLAAEDGAVDVHLAALSPARRAELEKEAIGHSGLNPRLFGRVILREHVRKLLGFEVN